jgi:protease I
MTDKGLKVAILVTDGFEEDELTEPHKALDDAGADTRIVSSKDKKVKGWKFTNWGRAGQVDAKLDQVRAQDFDALLLPGEVMNPEKLRLEPKAVMFVKAFFDAGKPIAAIYHGPWPIHRGGPTAWPDRDVVAIAQNRCDECWCEMGGSQNHHRW